MDCSNLARCSGGILASISGGISNPLVRVVVLISQAPGLALKDSAIADVAIPGMMGGATNPRMISIAELLNDQVVLVMVVSLPYEVDNCGKIMRA